MNKITLKPKEERKLLKTAKEGKGKKKRDAIWQLLYYNGFLVQYLARGFSSFNKQIEYDDLVAEGQLSLVKAIEKFDLSNKTRFATYAGHWIRQYFQSFINKNQIINQGSLKEKKNLIYYDSSYKNEDKENKTYSLAETLDDTGDTEISTEQVRQNDTIIQINNLINSLEDCKASLLTRLVYKIKPSNLADVYYMATDEEKKNLKKKLSLDKKVNLDLLQNYSLEDKVIKNLSIIKKYLKMFSQDYKFAGLVELLKKSEGSIRKLKQDSFKKMQKLARKRNLHFLTSNTFDLSDSDKEKWLEEKTKIEEEKAKENESLTLLKEQKKQKKVIKFR